MSEQSVSMRHHANKAIRNRTPRVVLTTLLGEIRVMSYELSYEGSALARPELSKVANAAEDQGERLVVPTGFDPVSEP